MTGAPPDRQPLFTRRSVSLAAVLTAVFAAILYLSGRPLWCQHGFGVWANAWTHCTSQHFLDPYSLTHISHGLLFFWLLQPLSRKVELRWRIVLVLAIEIAWELLENSPSVIERYRQDTAAFDYSGDSILNALGDVVMAVIGAMIAARVSWKVALALFILLELVALYLARDNLALNILMLLWPIEAVKNWQLPG